MQVVGFFDVAARFCAGDGPIAALVGSARSFFIIILFVHKTVL